MASSQTRAEPHDEGLPYEELVEGAREQYPDSEPPFTFPKSYVRQGHRYMVWLANANGDFEKRTESTQIYPLTLVAWDNNRSFWTVDVGRGRWIIASMYSKLRISGMPQSQWPVPYRRWLGADKSETGFSTAYVAYWTPAKPTDSSRPITSGVTAAATTTNAGSKSRWKTNTIQPLAPAPAAGSAHKTTMVDTSQSQQSTSGVPTTNRKRAQQLINPAAQKKVKTSTGPIRNVSRIIQRDTERQHNESTPTPSKTRWKTGKVSNKSTALRASTPDTSPSFERLTPPIANDITHSDHGLQPAWSATNHWTVAGQSGQRPNYLKSKGPASIMNGPTDQHLFNRRMVHDQVTPSLSGTMFKQLPAIPTEERTTTDMKDLASTVPKSSTSTIASLFAGLRSRFFSQDTEAKKEQLAVSISR